LESDHGREPHGSGHDGGMRGFAADISGETEHVLFVEESRGGGGEIVADDDARFREIAEVDLLFSSKKVIDHAGGDVPDVGSPFFQVFVVDGAKGLPVAVDDLLEGLLGGDLLREDATADFFDESGVFEDEQVSIEDGGISGSHPLGDLPLNIEDFLAGCEQSLFEPAELIRKVLVGEVLFGDGSVGLIEDKDFAAADTWADRYPA